MLRMPREASIVFSKYLGVTWLGTYRQPRGPRAAASNQLLALFFFLQILGGASYFDMQLVFGVGRSTVFRVFHSTLRAVNKTLKMPGVPVGDKDEMRASAEAFEHREILRSRCGEVSERLKVLRWPSKSPVTTSFLDIFTIGKCSMLCQFKLFVILTANSYTRLRAVLDQRMVRSPGQLVS
jgi:hypothetical protein